MSIKGYLTLKFPTLLSRAIYVFISIQFVLFVSFIFRSVKDEVQDNTGLKHMFSCIDRYNHKKKILKGKPNFRQFRQNLTHLNSKIVFYVGAYRKYSLPSHIVLFTTFH